MWDRTVKAISAYQKQHPHQHRLLFVTRNGTECDMQQLFLTIRKNAKLPTKVTFEGIRDAGFTIGEEVDQHHVKFVAGYKTGMSDKYVLRQAANRKVVAVCEAVERHFFGDSENKGKRKSRGKDK